MVGDTSIPLIPRKTFFENANALNPRFSPDGRWLAWIAAVDGVMNVWAAPRGDLTKARPLTRQTHDLASINEPHRRGVVEALEANANAAEPSGWHW
jgi:Tol biopolymer transport system component